MERESLPPSQARPRPIMASRRATAASYIAAPSCSILAAYLCGQPLSVMQSALGAWNRCTHSFLPSFLPARARRGCIRHAGPQGLDVQGFSCVDAAEGRKQPSTIG